MKRDKALELLAENIKNQNLQKHCLAVEAGMRGLAEYFGENKEKWGICGLLHDIDYEKTKDNPNLHSKMGAEMLKELGFEKEICQAVLTHNEAHKILPESKMAKAIFCLDPLTGLIVAATLVLPSKTELPFMEATRRDKSLLHPSLRLGQVKKRTKSSSPKISDLKVENVLHRFKEKSFARGANREIIKKCNELLGLSLEEFVKIVLEAMQKISNELGL